MRASLVPNDQLWFYHRDVQERIREAEESVTRGRLIRTETVREAQTFLDSLKRPDAAS